jgi:hypothetical protein
VTLGISLGASTSIELPVRPTAADEPHVTRFPAPEWTPPPAGGVTLRPWRTLTHELASGRIALDVGAKERTRLDRERLEFGEALHRHYEIVEGQPLSARVEYRARHVLRRAQWQISVCVHTTMSGTADAFLVTSELDVLEGPVRVFTRRSDVSIPRDLV